MAALLRRFSTISRRSPEDSATSRRRSSATPTNADARILGARDYKLALRPEDLQSRRSSATSTIVDRASDEEPLVARASRDSAGDGRIYGARDYKLITRRTSG